MAVHDLRGRDAEPLGDDAREHRGVALSGRLHVERQHEGVAAREAQRRAFERRAAGMLEHAGDAEAAQLAALKRFLAPLLEAVDVGELERLVDDHREFAGVVGGADGGLVGDRSRRDQVLLAQLDAVDAGQARGLVDHALEHVVRLRPARAAIGRRRGGVGEDALHADVDRADVVHAGKAAREVQRLQVGADRADIGAQVSEVPHPQRQELPVVVERKLRFGHRVARMGVVEERLRAARHPVHGTLGELGTDELRDVFGIGAGLHAEGAADVLGDDAELLLRHVHDRHGVVAHGARALRADAQMIAVARRVVARGRAARLHGDVGQPLLHDLDARDVLGGGDDLVDLGRIRIRIGMRAGPIERDIAGRFRPQLRRAGGLRRVHGDDRIDRLVVDLDEISRVLRREFGLRDHHRDRLAHIHHALARQRMPVRHHELGAVAARQRRMPRHAADAGGVDISGGHDRDHAAHFPGRIHVDPADAGVRMR